MEVDVMEFVREFVRKNFGRDVVESDRVSSFVDDSLDRVEMLMDLESEFGITVSDEELKAVVTVGDLVGVLRTKLGGVGG